MTQEQLGKLATYKPQPEYPMQARARHLFGAGFFVLFVTIQTVKDVQIEESTGSAILDFAAISAFKQTLQTWRTVADQNSSIGLTWGSAKQTKDYPIKVPVNFVMSRKS